MTTDDDNATLYTLGDRGQTVDRSVNDVRGREVKDKSGEGIGKVADLLVDDRENKVRFLLVEHGGFLGFGQTKTLIPVDAITKVTDDEVHINQSRDHVAGAPGYDPDLVDDRPYHSSVYGYYGYSPYWGQGYSYPIGLQLGDGNVPGDRALAAAAGGTGLSYDGNSMRAYLLQRQVTARLSPEIGMTRARPGIAGPVGAGAPLGLPGRVRACLFDLDGVLTDTATLHAAAWKEMFDRYLKARAETTGTTFVAFDDVTDYDTYVDGKTRADGIRSFLRSRDIDLPTGAPDDRAGAETVTGLGEAKNEILLRSIHRDGVVPYPGSVRFVRAVLAAGLHTAVVSSSANCAEVLDAAGIADLFETRIDGTNVEEQHLAGKPAPDTYLAAATVLGVDPDAAAVFEDALSGVAAGRAGGFGYVVGVDRVGQDDELRAHGADRVVTDLAQLLGRVDPA